MYGLTKFESFLRLNLFIVVTDSTTVLHWSTNIKANLISRATHMDDPPLSDKDSITQGNQDMFPLPWKQLQVGEKPNLIDMNQVSMSKMNNCPSSEYLPPSCKSKI